MLEADGSCRKHVWYVLSERNAMKAPTVTEKLTKIAQQCPFIIGREMAVRFRLIQGTVKDEALLVCSIQATHRSAL